MTPPFTKSLAVALGVLGRVSEASHASKSNGLYINVEIASKKYQNLVDGFFDLFIVHIESDSARVATQGGIYTRRAK